MAQDFDIKDEAKGPKRAVIKTFPVNVSNNIMDVHFFWAGRGTCCIPLQSTYGPLMSAIHVSQGYILLVIYSYRIYLHLEYLTVSSVS